MGLRDNRHLPARQVRANAASGVKLSDDLQAAVDQALADVPITEPTLAPAAQPGIKHR